MILGKIVNNQVIYATPADYLDSESLKTFHIVIQRQKGSFSIFDKAINIHYYEGNNLIIECVPALSATNIKTVLTTARKLINIVTLNGVVYEVLNNYDELLLSKPSNIMAIVDGNLKKVSIENTKLVLKTIKERLDIVLEIEAIVLYNSLSDTNRNDETLYHAQSLYDRLLVEGY